MISNDRLQKALEYLATTDDKCAKAKSLMIGLENQIKTVKSIAFLQADAKTATEREAIAYASETYREHINKHEVATYEYETMRNKRLTEELVVECWRSINASRRNGNII